MHGVRNRIISALVAVALVGAACGGSDDPTVEVDGVEVVDNATSPLSAWLRFDTSASAAVSAVLTSGDHVIEVPPGDAGTTHELAVIGMRPDRTYDVELVADGEPIDTGEAHQVTSGSLPAELSPYEVFSDPDRVEPGVIFFGLTPFGQPDLDGDGEPDEVERDHHGYILGVDEEGEVVWYYAASEGLGDITLASNGNLLVGCCGMAALELDLMGNVVREWEPRWAASHPVDDHGNDRLSDDAIPIDIEALHHELDELPNGDLITLSFNLFEVGPVDAPLCADREDHRDANDGFTPMYPVIGDTIVQFRPDTGEVVDEWLLSEAIDALEMPGWSFCDVIQPLSPFDDTPDAGDWSHGNAAVLDESRNAIISSYRGLDALVAVRYQPDDEGEAGEVLWISGPNGNVELAEGSEWARGQHDPEPQPDGSILVYDNGNMRPGHSFEEEPYHFSRAVWYDIDESGDTPVWRERWSHVALEEDGQPVFAPFVGDADLLPNGNVLITHGGRNPGRPLLLEVVPDLEAGEGGDVVWEWRSTDEVQQWFVYRADKLPSLYPPTS